MTLFAIAINNLTSVIKSLVQCSLFVDDFSIFCSSSSLETTTRQLQVTLTRLDDWTKKSGFNFPTEQSVCVPFNCSYSILNLPDLRMRVTVQQFKETARFLGLKFDTKLKWLPHLQDLKKRCLKALGILKCLSHNSWSADRTCVPRFYRGFVWSRLDYGRMVYGSANPLIWRCWTWCNMKGFGWLLGPLELAPFRAFVLRLPSCHCSSSDNFSWGDRDTKCCQCHTYLHT